MKNQKFIARVPVALKLAYRLISPGPIVLLSSVYNGRTGVTPIAWHMPVSDDPPIVALEVWKGHFIYKAIMQAKDFAITVPSAGMVKMVKELGSVSAKEIDKVARFAIEMQVSKKVRSPRLKDGLAVMECRLLKDERLAKKYDMVLGRVVYAEADRAAFNDRWLAESGKASIMHHLGGKIFSVPAKKIIT